MLAAAGVFSLASQLSAQVIVVPSASLTGTAFITFDDVGGGVPPGTNYNAIFESNGADFGERFVGQTVGLVAGFNDSLSGTPSGALALAVGAAGQNLNIFVNGSSQVLNGLGPTGFPNANSIGEGAFAVLFDFDQSEFGFDVVGGNSGTAHVDFFRRDGSLIHSINLTGVTNQSFGFSRVGGVHDIAGISIWNDDNGGIGFDNLRHDVAGVVGPPGAVPEPSTYGAFGVLLIAAVMAKRMKRRQIR